MRAVVLALVMASTASAVGPPGQLTLGQVKLLLEQNRPWDAGNKAGKDGKDAFALGKKALEILVRVVGCGTGRGVSWRHHPDVVGEVVLVGLSGVKRTKTGINRTGGNRSQGRVGRPRWT